MLIPILELCPINLIGAEFIKGVMPKALISFIPSSGSQELASV